MKNNRLPRHAKCKLAMTGEGDGLPRCIKRLQKKPLDLFLCLFTWFCAGITSLVLIFIVGYIIVNGISYIRPSLFAFRYNSDNVSLFPALVTTVMTVFLSLLIAVPFGVFSAIFLVEYTRRGNRLCKLVQLTSETLAGIPSIIYGLFGMLFFVIWLGWGMSVLAGACTLSVMILPLIMRTTEESMKSVPDTYREGAYGLGAGKLRTVFRIVLPAASPGILAGIILAIGRIVGETAALLYTAGSIARIPATPMSSGRTLAIHMYALSSEGLYTGQAYATALILLIVVIGINALSAYLAKKIVNR